MSTSMRSNPISAELSNSVLDCFRRDLSVAIIGQRLLFTRVSSAEGCVR